MAKHMKNKMKAWRRNSPGQSSGRLLKNLRQMQVKMSVGVPSDLFMKLYRNAGLQVEVKNEVVEANS